MNKKEYLLLVLLLIANIVWGQPLSPQECVERIQEFSFGNERLKTLCKGEKLELSFSVHNESSGEPIIYVFNNNDGGFVVSSGDKAVPIILGYSEDGVFDVGNIPEAMSWLLESYSYEINLIKENRTNLTQQKNVGLPDISPLLSCQWGQGTPYNRICPKDKNGNPTVAGCAATAMAQVLYYHRWPEKGKGFQEYSFHMDGEQVTIQEDLSKSEYQWDEMLDSYSEYTDAQANAVAQLMYDCGIASKMAYGTSGSSTSFDSVEDALINNFGYNKGLKYIKVGDIDDTSIIYHELEKGNPVIMRGSLPTYQMGHIFVCDGYNSDGYYHINWGWAGSFNGYFLLSSLIPSEGRDYSYGKGAIVNIHPPLYQNDLEIDYTMDGNACLTGVSEHFSKAELVIPSNVMINGKTYTVTTINENAFKGCSTLKQVTIPGCINEIGDEAFSDCEQLEKVVFEKGSDTLYLGYNSFYNVQIVTMNRYLAIRTTKSNTPISPFVNVETVVIGNGVCGISDRLFCQSTKLSKVQFNNEIASIGEYAFANCRLKDFSLPTSLKSIGKGAFTSIDATKVELPEGLEIIGEEAFEWCKNLESIHLPLSLKEIGFYAFSETPRLALYAYWTNPIELKTSIKGVLSKKLYVPIGTSDLYKERGWNGFEIIEIDYSGVSTVRNEIPRVKERYNLHGIPLNFVRKGISIESMENGAARKVLTH